MSLKRYLYVMGSTTNKATDKKIALYILNRFEFSGYVKFALFDDLQEHANLIAVAHDQEKYVKFYDLAAFL